MPIAHCNLDFSTVKKSKIVSFDFLFRNVSEIDLSRIFGLILNVPSDFKLLGLVPNPFNSKHWIAIKGLSGGTFYNLDSKLVEPKLIGQEQEIIAHLSTELNEADRELLIVVKEDVDSVFSGD